MKRKWGKGDPVNLSDLLRITPVANEIMQLSEDLSMSCIDVMWIASQIIDNSEDVDEQLMSKIFDDEGILDDEWDDIELDNLEDEMDLSRYIVNIKISSDGRFPEIGFKAGINEKEDINYFFDMVMEMLEKLD
ncbi:MAG TPA: hypothetical protein VFC73_00055 [Syntrophomonadaceae bacterium]|nr:hypothetical protein [Syntrophomonadaceae bacterium]